MKPHQGGKTTRDERERMPIVLSQGEQLAERAVGAEAAAEESDFIFQGRAPQFVREVAVVDGALEPGHGLLRHPWVEGVNLRAKQSGREEAEKRLDDVEAADGQQGNPSQQRFTPDGDPGGRDVGENGAIDEFGLRTGDAEHAADIARQQIGARASEEGADIGGDLIEQALERGFALPRAVAKSVEQLDAFDFDAEAADVFTCGGVGDDQDEIDIGDRFGLTADGRAAE